MLLPLETLTYTVTLPALVPVPRQQKKPLAIGGAMPAAKFTVDGSLPACATPAGVMVSQPLPVKLVTVRLPKIATALVGMCCLPVPVPAIWNVWLVPVPCGP